MRKLSALVKQDYDEEVKIIREAGGRLWPKWIGFAIVGAVLWGLDLLVGNPWSKRDIYLGMIVVLIAPFVTQAWDRYETAAKMRHQRAVRVEVKLDALLGLVNIKDIE